MEGIVLTRAAIYEKENPTRGNGSKKLSSLFHHSVFFAQPSRKYISSSANRFVSVAQRGSLIEHIMAFHRAMFGPFHLSAKVWRNDEKVATP
jgi:hypothetical protein